jgi:hypothetical protein
VLIYTIQAISRPLPRQGIVQPSGLPIQMQTRQTSVQQVRIVPHGTHYSVEVIYEQPIAPAPLDPALVAAIDIGVNNLTALTANLPGFAPRLCSPAGADGVAEPQPHPHESCPGVIKRYRQGYYSCTAWNSMYL